MCGQKCPICQRSDENGPTAQYDRKATVAQKKLVTKIWRLPSLNTPNLKADGFQPQQVTLGATRLCLQFLDLPKLDRKELKKTFLVG